MHEMDIYPDEKRQQAERTMAIQSVAAAGMQLLLAAHAEGLGGVWACWPLFAQEIIQKTLNICESWEPQAMMFLGYQQDIPAARERKILKDIVQFNDGKSRRDDTTLEWMNTNSNPEGMA
jgi:coenzyme F420-0:L-glutamate ligase/coenzyme F420-1:gamma-L-glutamate ligase